MRFIAMLFFGCSLKRYINGCITRLAISYILLQLVQHMKPLLTNGHMEGEVDVVNNIICKVLEY